MIFLHVQKSDPAVLKAAHKGESILAPFECDRLQGMHPDNQASFVTGRTVLRQMLGRWLGVAAEQVPLKQEGAGRVFLDFAALDGAHATREGLENLSFSVSHTGTGSEAYVAVAVGGQAVGVDLDCYRRRVDWRRISDRHFHPENRKYIDRQLIQDQPQAFFRVWTLAEALVKLEDGKLLPYLHGCAFNFPPTYPDGHIGKYTNANTGANIDAKIGVDVGVNTEGKNTRKNNAGKYHTRENNIGENTVADMDEKTGLGTDTEKAGIWPKLIGKSPRGCGDISLRQYQSNAAGLILGLVSDTPLNDVSFSGDVHMDVGFSF